MPNTFEVPMYVLIYILLPIVVGIVSFIGRNINSRLVALEEDMQNTTTEPQVRQLISDKYDPLCQDIRDIKESQRVQDEKLDKLTDMIIQSLQTKN